MREKKHKLKKIYNVKSFFKANKINKYLVRLILKRTKNTHVRDIIKDPADIKNRIYVQLYANKS